MSFQHLLSVLCVGGLISLGTATGLHNLRYDITVFSQDGSVQTQFIAEGYFNGELFLHYDTEKDLAELQGPWAEAYLRSKTQDLQTVDFKDKGMEVRMTLSDIMKQQDQKKGLHSLQETLGCEIQEDSGPRGFWDYCYDGTPFLSYHPETQRWTAPRPLAQNLSLEMKKTWDEDREKHKYYSYYVQGDICEKLWSYSDPGSNVVERTVVPAVNMTFTEDRKGNVTVTCWAVGFYPRKITLTWLQDGKPLGKDSQEAGSTLSGGNGTYVTWVSTWLPQGEEQRYSCHVEHSGKNTTYPVSHGGNPIQNSTWQIICGVITFAIIIFAVVIFAFRWYKKSPDVKSQGEKDAELLERLNSVCDQRPGLEEQEVCFSRGHSPCGVSSYKSRANTGRHQQSTMAPWNWALSLCC